MQLATMEDEHLMTPLVRIPMRQQELPEVARLTSNRVRCQKFDPVFGLCGLHADTV